jgi:hypothetical protein
MWLRKDGWGLLESVLIATGNPYPVRMGKADEFYPSNVKIM